MNATAARTGRSIVAGTWGCAVITMAGSAASAAVAYDYLGEHWGLGLATGVAVDIALCVALVGDRRLYAHGLASNWGRALRITTALMSLVLNAGVAFVTGHYFLAVLHAFLPVLLVVLTEYGQDVLLKLTALHRDAEDATTGTHTAVEQARHEAYESANQERDNLTAELTTLRAELAAERDKRTTAEQTLRDKQRDTERHSNSRDKPVATAEQRRAWVRRQFAAGRNPTGADVHKQFPHAPRDGARIVRQVAAEVQPQLLAVATGGGGR